MNKNRPNQLQFFDVVLLSLAIGLSIIGIHQSLIVGFQHSYWIFMITLILLFWVKIRLNKPKAVTNEVDTRKKQSSQRRTKVK